MRLDPYIRDYSSFVEELAQVVGLPGTRLYLDTSLLMWLIRLGAKPRGEFLAWARERPAGTIRVPVWCAHELHTHIVKGSIASTLRSVSGQTERKYFEFARFAAERADDAVCMERGFAGRDGFLSEVQASLAKLKRMMLVVQDDRGIGEAADEIIEFANQHLLGTDLDPILRDVGQDGELRYSHLMPPGFHDKKEEDRFGDLIIWREIAADMPKPRKGAKKRPAAVLISRDAKTDWVSTAPRILDEKDKVTGPNRDQGYDVALTHPLLIHEFEQRTVGCALYVVHPGMLATAMTIAPNDNAPNIANWLSAAYRPDHINNVIELARKFPSQRPPAAAALPLASGPVSANAVAEIAAEQPTEAFLAPPLNELLAPEVMRAVAEARVATSADQSTAIAAWIGAAKAGQLSPVGLGARLSLFYAASERATDLPALLEATAGELPLASRRLLILAIGAQAYFDAAGQLLRPPRIPLANVLIAAAADTQLAPAYAALAALLHDASANLLYIPGQTSKPSFQLDLAEGPDSEPKRLRAIKIAGENVLTDLEGPEAATALARLIGAATCTGAQLRLLLAHHYGIAPGALVDTWDKRKLKWDLNAGLAELDPEAPGGVSPLNDGDDL